MRKLICALAITALVLGGLCACAGEEAPAPAQAQSEQSQQEPSSQPPESADASASNSQQQSAAPPSQSEAEPEPESEAESQPESQAEPEPQDIFPYLPETFDYVQRLPVLYGFDSQFDRTRNNHKVGGVSFYLDDALFQRQPTEYDFFQRYDAVENSAAGPCIMTILAEDYTALRYFVTDSAGVLDPVHTLNAQLESFLERNPGETFTYFSEEVGGRYIPAAAFVTDNAMGFIYYVTDGQTILSIQFLSYDSNYVEVQRDIMSDLLASISFS